MDYKKETLIHVKFNVELTKTSGLKTDQTITLKGDYDVEMSDIRQTIKKALKNMEEAL